jgi:hypothetical protein
MHRNLALGLISFALVAALAPGPRAADDAQAMKTLAETKAALARKIADFFADPRLAAVEKNGEERGIPGTDNVEAWTRRYIDARLDAASGKDDRIKILQEDVDRTRAIEARIKALADDAPGFGKLDALKAEYYRVDAEYRLAREKDGR